MDATRLVAIFILVFITFVTLVLGIIVVKVMGTILVNNTGEYVKRLPGALESVIKEEEIDEEAEVNVTRVSVFYMLLFATTMFITIIV